MPSKPPRSLHRFRNLVYADFTWGSASPKSMQRLTARFLLLFALIGTFVPIALQAMSVPTHACCRRSAAHHCDDSAITTDETVIRNAGCNRDCCRAVTVSQPAHPVRRQTNIFAQHTTVPIGQLQANAPVTDLFLAHSTRAPPAC